MLDLSDGKVHFEPGSIMDVGIDVGKARLAWAWPTFGKANFIDLGRSKTPRHLELRMLQNWVAEELPPSVQLWIDRPLFAGTGTESGARLTETVSAVLSAQAWEREPQIVFSQTWKSQVVGNHQAAKDDLKDWLWANYPDLWAVCTTEDEVDAMIIGLYGRGRSSGHINPPDVRRPKRKAKKA